MFFFFFYLLYICPWLDSDWYDNCWSFLFQSPNSQTIKRNVIQFNSLIFHTGIVSYFPFCSNPFFIVNMFSEQWVYVFGKSAQWVTIFTNYLVGLSLFLLLLFQSTMLDSIKVHQPLWGVASKPYGFNHLMAHLKLSSMLCAT